VNRIFRFWGSLLALLILSATGATATTTSSWLGGSSTSWHDGGNWTGSQPDGDFVAKFDSGFVLGANQPWIGTAADSIKIIKELRITDPEQDVVLSIDNGAGGGALNIDANASSGTAISMSAATKNLTILGWGKLVQRNNGGDATWLITGSGDLTIDTARFTLQAQALTIRVNGGRTADIKIGADNTAASVTKENAGKLIHGGQNGWTGATTIDDGMLVLATNNAISSASALVFNDTAELKTGGFNGTFSTIDINDTVTFDFEGLGTSQLTFADSTAISWNAATLNIVNLSEGDSIRFGTDANGLTAAQMTDITVNGESGFVLDNEGYLILEPSTDSTLILY
jgi:hypothetical protein